MRLDGLQEHGNQHILPDILLGAACNVVGVRLADECVPQLFLMTHILVAHQRTLAVGAVDQPLEDIFGGFQMREPAEIVKVFCLFALGKFLNLVKGLPVDQRLVGIFHDDPVLFWLHVLTPIFVEGLPLCALHHVSDVHLPRQNVFDRLNIPDYTVVLFCFANPGIIQIGGGRRHASIVEPPCDLSDANALGTPPKYLPDNGSRCLVRFQFVRIIRAFAVAIGCPRADEIAIFLLRGQRGAGLPGNILAVDLIDEIFQRNQITVRAALGSEGIKTVIDGDETHAKKRKNAFQIVAGFLVVSAKAG